MSNILTERDEAIRAYYGRVPSLEEARRHCANHQNVPPLRPLKRPCHDCAIVCEFYTPIAAVLSLLPAAEVDQRALEWYCHNHPNRACAGNIQYQKRVREALRGVDGQQPDAGRAP